MSAFLRGSAATMAGIVTAQTASGTQADPLITKVQDWASLTGDGVDATPYGLPIKFESDVVRRNVPWLTASPISSINFTPIHLRTAAHIYNALPITLLMLFFLLLCFLQLQCAYLQFYVA